jgi:DNA-binding GntR family transcriptional regulator
VSETGHVSPDALASSSLVELATTQLRQEILGGAFAPGERIVEEQVTRRFGISRAPLREALRLLAQEGIVEHLPRRGARVATLSKTDVEELFDLRDVLERHAVTVALPLQEGGLDGVREQLAAMQAAAASGGGLALHDAHRRFHVALVALSRHGQLLRTYQQVLLRLQLHMALNLRREAQVQEEPLLGVRRHEALLAALESDDPAVVLEALARHGATTYLD